MPKHPNKISFMDIQHSICFGKHVIQTNPSKFDKLLFQKYTWGGGGGDTDRDIQTDKERETETHRETEKDRDRERDRQSWLERARKLDSLTAD